MEVDERIVLDKNGEGGWEQTGNNDGSGAAMTAAAAAVVQGVTGEGVRVVKEPDLAAVRSSLQVVLDQGITSLAVVFMHRYDNVCRDGGREFARGVAGPRRVWAWPGRAGLDEGRVKGR